MVKHISRWQCDECGQMFLSGMHAELCEDKHVEDRTRSAFRAEVVRMLAKHKKPASPHDAKDDF